MLRIAICDDDARFGTQAIDLLENWPNKPSNISMSYLNSADALLLAHAASPFDVILLDVAMPLMNGIETAQEIRGTDTVVKIIFTTSSPEFAVASYSVKAFDYLLKPVSPAALYRALDEIMIERQREEKYILVHSGNGVHRVKLDDIDCVEAQKKHSLLILAEKETILCAEPFHFFEAELLKEKQFLQCHRSFIVNIDNITFMGSNELQTLTGYRVPISRGNKESFTKLYFERLFKQ